MRVKLGPYSVAFLERVLAQAHQDGATYVRVDVDSEESLDGRGKVHLMKADKDLPPYIINGVQYVIKPCAVGGGKLQRHVISEV